MKFKLEAQDENYKVQIEFEEYTLPNILESMENFLKGCGYIFENLEVTKKEEDE